ncbi:hypothetical protein EBT31_10715 [bacterium]|nr:hypothetical protein [bacterium]
MAQVTGIFMLYGIPRNPMTDSNYYNFFRWGLLHLPQDAVILLGGGATDPGHSSATEAEVAKEILHRRLHVPDERIHAIPRGLDAREVLEIHASKIPRDSRVTIFCAWTHQDLVRFHARRLFGERAKIVPLAFPAHMPSGSVQAWILRLRRVPRTLLGMAGVHLRRVRALELWLRRRHMEAASHRQA